MPLRGLPNVTQLGPSVEETSKCHDHRDFLDFCATQALISQGFEIFVRDRLGFTFLQQIRRLHAGTEESLARHLSLPCRSVPEALPGPVRRSVSHLTIAADFDGRNPDHDFQPGYCRRSPDLLGSGIFSSASFHAERSSPSTKIPLTSAQLLRKLEHAATMTTSIISPSLKP